MRTCLFFCILTSFAFGAPSIRVSKPISMIDEELTIEIKEVQPFQRILLRAETVDAAGEKWSSEALFCADERGRVRLTRNAPLEGSYTGVDGMGLFWSLQPESTQTASFKIPEEMHINLILIANRHPIAAKQIQRLKKRSDVRRSPLREKGLVGTLFSPPSKHPLPVIITLDGWNGGGVNESRAQILASHGFAVLALSYFGLEGLPAHLENIPLEYFKTAFQWIKTRPDLDDKNVGLFGLSRGAELALLLGTLFPDSMHAIVATVPTSVTFGSFENLTAPAWTYQGEALTTSSSTLKLMASLMEGESKARPDLGKNPQHPLKTTSFLLKAMEKEVLQEGAIPVEKIRCPLLLISGGDDQMWPSALFATQIKERLENKGSKIYCRHYNYPKAGHHIYIPFLPTSRLYCHPLSKQWFLVGGTAQADNQASLDSWRKIVVFFQSKLKNGSTHHENP